MNTLSLPVNPQASWCEASVVGIMMNTRLMELIVINVGYDLGIIPRSVFFMLVFTAVFTTYVTAPLLRRLIPKTELEPYFQAVTFGQRDRWARAASTADRRAIRAAGAQ